MDADATALIREQVLAAAGQGSCLRIVGGGSKQFYGREIEGAVLPVSEHRGILAYDPAELVLTARAGTPLTEIEAVLAQAGQCMPFEPPHFGGGATLGGTIACGIAGPARAYAGAVKDFVLGATLMNGKGQSLRFGGQVMKNVAGYDVARAMVGSVGTLGLLMDVSMKVLPRAPHSATRVFEFGAQSALQQMSDWAQKASCISATCWVEGRLFVRLSGSEAAIQASALHMGGDAVEGCDTFWRSVREQSHAFFESSPELIRIVVPASCPAQSFAADCLFEWGGAQRWLRTDSSIDDVRAAARVAGGFATRFRTSDRRGEVFEPVPDAQLRLQKSLKAVFDPNAIFNRGRLHAQL